MFDTFFEPYENDRDALTGLYRRNVITDYMEYLISENKPFSFVMLDVDNFKLVNDTYGHLKGDEVLQNVAETLLDVTDGKGVVGRYGGDEFVFVIPNIVEYDEIWQFCYNALRSSAKIELDSANLSVSYTLGVSRFSKDATNIDELIALADKALYRGKVKGRNCFIIYLPEKHANIELQSIRDKVYSPINLHSKIYAMLTRNNSVKDNIKRVFNFVGPYLMLDHFCIEVGDSLLFEYNHPLAPKKTFEPYGDELIRTLMNGYGMLIQNAVVTSELKGNSPMIDRMIKDGVYACCIVAIEAFGQKYGYLRAEMTSVDTGRIWQNEDLVLLQYIASMIGILLYAKKQEI